MVYLHIIVGKFEYKGACELTSGLLSAGPVPLLGNATYVIEGVIDSPD